MKTELKNKSKRNVMFIVRQAIYTHSPAKTLKKLKHRVSNWKKHRVSDFESASDDHWDESIFSDN